MELSKSKINETKGIAIIFMLLLHLFCTKNYVGLFLPTIYLGQYPLIYYIALFGDCCVAIYCFSSGYGLMYNYQNNSGEYSRKNYSRIFRLYIKYWIITIIFVFIAGYWFQKTGYPGNYKKILLSISGISPGYNGAWWFFTTYILLVLFSGKINKIIQNKNTKLVLIVSFVLYVLGYVQRIKVLIVLNNIYFDYFLRQLSLLLTSGLPFIMGAVFQKEKIYSYLSEKTNKIKYKNLALYSILLALGIFHGFVETLFVGAFIGIIFIPIFNLLDKKEFVSKFLDYMGTHSTNLWLIHMFFYMIYLKEIVYYPKYPLFIFVWLIVLLLPFSHFINYLEKIIFTKILRRD
ncbi:acyltransferase family protein [Cetobacterium sp.]|uniref:acyltransferase family protein n=1 Tax=Cetobacterium sp. TaxID=2071632 RepID=UPI003F2DDF52